jgi:simple sugar transport system ATP-binding protein
MEYFVQMKDIHKSFGRVLALKGVNFNVEKNEIVGLVGDNGAGKSTLIKILTGFISPDKGEIYINGEKVENLSVSKARQLGIGVVYQERALVEQHVLWRNIFMGSELTNRLGFIRVGEQKKEAERLIREIGFTSRITPDSVVGWLSGGERQGVAIARALYFEANLIILDEPTVGLSLSEAHKVLDFVQEIKEKGRSCIMISHNIYHVYPVADRFVILDRGKNVGEIYKKDISINSLEGILAHVAKTGEMPDD